MPQNKFQKLMFALITVIITVPCFVCYCLAIENGGMSNEIFIKALWLIPIELVCAYLCEIFIGSPLSMKLAFRAINPKENNPVIVETAIICTTVCIMCPLMSFIATFLYNGFGLGTVTSIMESPIFLDPLNFFSNFLVYWLPKVIVNFPFALLTQLFFIQPFVRNIFKHIFVKNNKKNEDNYKASEEVTNNESQSAVVNINV